MLDWKLVVISIELLLGMFFESYERIPTPWNLLCCFILRQGSLASIPTVCASYPRATVLPDNDEPFSLPFVILGLLLVRFLLYGCFFTNEVHCVSTVEQDGLQ